MTAVFGPATQESGDEVREKMDSIAKEIPMDLLFQCLYARVLKAKRRLLAFLM